MNPPRSIFAVIFFLVMSSSFAFAQQSLNSTCSDSLYDSVKKVDAEVPDFEITISLFNSPTFIQLWGASDCYEISAKALLVDSNVSTRQKLIISYAMQSLKLPLLVDFYSDALKLRQRNEISQDLFMDIIFPGYNWNTKLADNFEVPSLFRLPTSGIYAASFS